jgi:hypothetical protein
MSHISYCKTCFKKMGIPTMHGMPFRFLPSYFTSTRPAVFPVSSVPPPAFSALASADAEAVQMASP